MATGKLFYFLRRTNKAEIDGGFLRKLRLKPGKKKRNSVVVNKEKKRSWLTWFWMTITAQNKRKTCDIDNSRTMISMNPGDSSDNSDRGGGEQPAAEMTPFTGTGRILFNFFIRVIDSAPLIKIETLHLNSDISSEGSAILTSIKLNSFQAEHNTACVSTPITKSNLHLNTKIEG